jgi:hypothetical protein
MYLSLHVKYPLFLSYFNDKILKHQTSLKNCPVEADLFHADRQTDGWAEGQTDMMRLIASCRKFLNVPKKERFTKSRIIAVFTFTPTAY